MNAREGRPSYLALLAAVLVFIAASAHLELSAAADAQKITVGSVPNVHLANASQYVSDPGRVLPEQAIATINRYAADLNARLGVELAVVVLKDVGENDAREFATDLFNAWGLGKKGKDNGLLILLITEPPQRSVTFETGYGIEGVLPDAITFRLQQRYMVPDFRNGEWAKGLVSGVKAVSDYLLASPEEKSLIAPPVPAEKREEDISPLSAALFFIGLFALLYLFKRNPTAVVLLLSSIFNRRGGGGGWGGGRGGGGGSWGGGSSGGGGSISRF